MMDVLLLDDERWEKEEDVHRTITTRVVPLESCSIKGKKRFGCCCCCFRSNYQPTTYYMGCGNENMFVCVCVSFVLWESHTMGMIAHIKHFFHDKGGVACGQFLRHLIRRTMLHIMHKRTCSNHQHSDHTHACIDKANITHLFVKNKGKALLLLSGHHACYESRGWSLKFRA